MSNVTKYTRDAFKSLSLLEDVDFELTDKDSFQKLDTFINDDGDIPVETEVIDLDAENEEELKDSYVGDGILSCAVCHTNMFKAIEDVVIDEETGLCCVGEECPVCGNTDGFKILGKVAPFEEEAEVEVETEPDEAEVEIKEKVRESFKKRSAKKALKEKIAKRSNKQRLMEANLSNNAYTVIETSYDEETNKQEFNDLKAAEVYFLKTLASYVNAGFDDGQVISLYKGNDLICEGEATSISDDFLETTETLALDSFSDRKENEPKNIKDFIKYLYGTRWLIEYLVDRYDFTDINDNSIDLIEADIFPTNEDKEDFINWIIKSCDSLHNVNESLTEEVSSIAYDIANKIEDRFRGETFISWDDFEEAYYDFLPDDFIERYTDEDNDLKTDVRGILSYSGWETIFEGEDEGGLRLVESKSRTSKRLTEDKGDLNKLDQDIQDIVGEYFDYTMDFDFLDIVGDVLLRVDDFEEDAKDAWETVDSTLIYGDDQWNVLRHYVDSPADLGDGSWDDAFAQFVNDIEQICQRVAAQRGGEDTADDVVTEGVSKKARKGRKLTEAEAPIIARDVTDQVIVKRGEPGFISKMHDLRAQGYEMLWSGDGQMVFAKPKELVKTDPETGEIIESKQAITDSALKKFRSKKLTEKKKEVCPDCGKEICECDKTKTESLAEDIEKATIETENEVINLSSEEKDLNANFDATEESDKAREEEEMFGLDEFSEDAEEVVAPLSDDDVAEIEANSEEETEEEDEEETFPEDEEEFDFDEVQEESFNRLGEQYLKKVYSNVDTFKFSNVSADNNKLVLEGVITFNSGKTKKTSFVFEKVENKNSIAKSKARYVGLNETFTDKKNAYVLNVKKNGKTLVAESLRYNYPAKTKNLNEEVKVVKGLVK